eukprot:6874382-Prymnesium_polylepis.1
MRGRTRCAASTRAQTRSVGASTAGDALEWQPEWASMQWAACRKIDTWQRKGGGELCRRAARRS